jgi:hypothetical protein
MGDAMAKKKKKATGAKRPREKTATKTTTGRKAGGPILTKAQARKARDLKQTIRLGLDRAQRMMNLELRELPIDFPVRGDELPLGLSDYEDDIYEALKQHGPLDRHDLAAKSGHAPDSYFGSRLTGMKKAGVIVNQSPFWKLPGQ